MPRARKNTQPVQVAPGETYGRRQELEQMQAQQPLPAVSGQIDPQLFPAARDAALNMPAPEPGGILGREPVGNQPLQAGLSQGPGPGPEAIRMPTNRRDRLRQQLELAAELTNNDRLRQMAQEANMRPVPKITRHKQVR